MLRCALLLTCSVILFLYGFFPMSNKIINSPNDPPNKIGNISINLSKIYAPHAEKVVLIIIDGLRWDFVTPKLMPQTMEIMNKKGCLIKVLVESPTVTLPRIKALTTGSVPQYIDIVRNLASSEILIDSWLHSAKRKGLKMVFYGDNTWEKLFPDFFVRSEGTTSFFVWDFTEVDNNVTRNVNEELERHDWDIMILHYLGLDHIGHVLGPFSSRITTKLTEMDSVIHKIYETLSHVEKSLILITGDHGMRDGGGHGGTTQPEVTVPLIPIGLKCQNSSILQTDIPVNLAVLLGLNIPSTSIGKLHKSMLDNLNVEQYLFALRYNTELLLKKNNLFTDYFEKATRLHEKILQNDNYSFSNMSVELYTNCSDGITKSLYEASSKQDTLSLVVAILIMLNILELLLQQLITSKHEKYVIYIFICFSVSTLQFFLGHNVLSNIFIFILAILCILALKELVQIIKTLKFQHSLYNALIFTCTVHPITFISTSFIEEEHYYWIFFSVTVIFLAPIHFYNESKVIEVHYLLSIILVLTLIRFATDLNSTIENSVQNTENWANFLNNSENTTYCNLFLGFSLLLIFCIFQKSCKLRVYGYLNNTLIIITLVLIFIHKFIQVHHTLLGKLIWVLIFSQKIIFPTFSWLHFWILAVTLLIKPHNTILIPIAIYTGVKVCNLNHFKHSAASAVFSYTLSNLFYFLQGHRNSLASVDISIGYTGLNDYYPFLVITQVLIHTYAFQVLFHLLVLESIFKYKEQKTFWITLLALRTSVIMFTCIVTIIFRHHLFIWSVFAPKLFIESIHTGFLFLEICIWHSSGYLKKISRL